MKRTLALAFLLMSSLFLFTSCQKDNEDLIIGTWNMDVYQSTDNGTPYITKWLVTFVQINFCENGTINGYWHEEDEIDAIQGTYAVNGNQLYLAGLSWTIEELTRKKLIITTYRNGGIDRWVFDRQ